MRLSKVAGTPVEELMVWSDVSFVEISSQLCPKDNVNV